MTSGVVERAKTFKEVWENLEGYNEKDLMQRKIEALYLEVKYLESVVEVLATSQITKKHRKATQQAVETTEDTQDDKLVV